MKKVLLLVGLVVSVVGQGYVYLHENQQYRTPNRLNNLFDPSAYVYKQPSAVSPNVFSPQPANRSPSTQRSSSQENSETQDPPIQPETSQNLPSQHYEAQRLPLSSPPVRSPAPPVASFRQLQAPSEPQQAGLPASTTSRGGPSLEEIYASLERRVDEYHKQQREQQHLESFYVPPDETRSQEQRTYTQPVPHRQQPDIYSRQHNNNQHRQAPQPQQRIYTNELQYNNMRVQQIRSHQAFEEPVREPQSSSQPASTVNGQGSESLEELYAELERSVIESQKQQKESAKQIMTFPRQPVYGQITNSYSQYNNRPEDVSVLRRRPVSIARNKRRQRQRRRRLRPQTSITEEYNVPSSRPSRSGGRTAPPSHPLAPARSTMETQPEEKSYDADLVVASLPPDTDGDGIPGEAGVDYPTLNTIIRTSFSCLKQPLNGYYADLETSCQVVHMCQAGGIQDSYLCPNGTIFSQAKFSCQWWYKVDCAKSVNYYNLNAALYKTPEPPKEERRRN